MRLLAGVCLCSLMLTAQDIRDLLERASDNLRNGRIEAALQGFAQAVRRDPPVAPHLWQRGIAQYYAGQYKECAAQFELHRTVNPADVENAAWHFLCVARQISATEARKRLLPVGVDQRQPMREIYAMFRGELGSDDVLRAAGSDRAALFYGHLYIGLLLEAHGKATEARKHLEEASNPRYAEFGGYMHDIARLHVNLLSRTNNLDRRKRIN